MIAFVENSDQKVSCEDFGESVGAGGEVKPLFHSSPSVPIFCCSHLTPGIPEQFLNDFSRRPYLGRRFNNVFPLSIHYSFNLVIVHWPIVKVRPHGGFPELTDGVLIAMESIAF